MYNTGRDSVPYDTLGRHSLLRLCRELKTQESARRRSHVPTVSKGCSLEHFQLVFGVHPIVQAAYRILKAHAMGLFEQNGNQVLRSFLSHVAQNLDVKSPNGLRHGDFKLSMMLYEVILIKGGRWLAEFVARNLAGPRKVDTITRMWRNECRYSLGLDGTKRVIQDITRIYERGMKLHDITPGSVPFLLSEDETCCLSKVHWDQSTDELWNFCGTKCSCDGKCTCDSPHVCKDSVAFKVGDGQTGYTNVATAFKTQKIGSYGRVVMICPLHSQLAPVPLLICATCNCFTSDYVRSQWCSLSELCSTHLRQVLGPMIGHASDGDSRRRRLQLADMTPTSGIRFRPSNCRGFALTGHVNGAHASDISGLHSQDPIHNGKKLINVIFSARRSLFLGSHLISISHLNQILETYGPSCGLTSKDVLRKDRQNWASAQRLCRSRVLALLKSHNATTGEPCLGSYYYLRMVWRFIHIFFSKTATIRRRIFLCSYVIHFLVRWKWWIKVHRTLTCAENFITTEAYTDVLIACHQAILIVRLYSKMNNNNPICFEKIGSDCCEKFFSAMGSWVTNKRTYDPATMALQSKKHRRLQWIMNEQDGPVWSSKKRTKDAWDKEFEDGCDATPAPDFDLTSCLSNYKDISDAVISELWSSGDNQAKDDLEALGMKPTATTHHVRADNSGEPFPWWSPLTAKALTTNSIEKASTSASTREKEARSCDRDDNELVYLSDVSVNSDDDDNDENNTPHRFIQLPNEMSTSKLARLLSTTSKAIVSTCSEYSTSFLGAVRHNSIFDAGSMVPVPPSGIINPDDYSLSYIDHRNRPIYMSNESALPVHTAASTNPADSPASDDDGSDGDSHEEDDTLTPPKPSQYLPLPDTSTMIHKATLVSYFNINPQLSSDRLCRVMQGARSRGSGKTASNTTTHDSNMVGINSLVIFKRSSLSGFKFGRILKMTCQLQQTSARKKKNIKCEGPVLLSSSTTSSQPTGAISVLIQTLVLASPRQTALPPLSFKLSVNHPFYFPLTAVSSSIDHSSVVYDAAHKTWTISDKNDCRTISSKLLLSNNNRKGPSYYVGWDVRKKFGTVFYKGQVQSYCTERVNGKDTVLYKVLYCDGDGEDLNLNELLPVLVEDK